MNYILNAVVAIFLVLNLYCGINELGYYKLSMFNAGIFFSSLLLGFIVDFKECIYNQQKDDKESKD